MAMLLGVVVSSLAAILPTVIYVFIFYWADRYEREPKGLLFITFVWGALPAVIVSLIGEIWLGAPFVDAPGSLAESLVEGAIVAPIIEELAKGAALFWLFWRRRNEFDGVLDGILYGALVGFGFAMTENFLYFVGAFADGGFAELSAIIILRAVIFGLNHALYTGITGIGLGLARNRQSRPLRYLIMIVAVLCAILVHGLHNLGAGLASVNAVAFLISLALAAAGFGLFLIAVLLSWQHERRFIQRELASEVGVLLGPQELEELVDHWRRPKRATRAVRDRRQLFVELAIRKHRMRRLGSSHEDYLQADIADIRTELAAGYRHPITEG